METSDKPNQDIKVEATASQSDLVASAKLLFDHIENQIKTADSKAWLMIAANGIMANLFVGLTGEIFKIASINKIFAAILSILIFATLLGSVFCALWVVKPSLKGPKTQSLFYFGDIQRKSFESFSREFNGQSLTEISDGILAQVYIKSKIAHRKFKILIKGLYFFFGSLVFSTIAQIILNVYRGL